MRECFKRGVGGRRGRWGTIWRNGGVWLGKGERSEGGACAAWGGGAGGVMG
jgi:hypothetical protein